ncbi:MAG: cbb3-type cytochrome c oxidase subunit II [Chthoniobacteraceae bacterium]
MHKPGTLFTGIFGAFALSCGVMVLIPHSELASLQPQVQWDEGQNAPGDVYPQKRSIMGREVYVAEGCFYCHSQQVRDPQYGPDMERGWGPRRTVARDYLYESVPLLGSMRLGPDFANFGWTAKVAQKDGSEKTVHMWRNEPEDDTKKPAVRDERWIYQHLYNPRTIFSDSKCPPYRFLFEQREIGQKLSPNAVEHDEKFEMVPTLEAEKLAAYLLSLDCSHELKESPTLIKPKEAKK